MHRRCSVSGSAATLTRLVSYMLQNCRATSASHKRNRAKTSPRAAELCCLVEQLAGGASRPMHPARVAAAHSIHRQTLHPARFLQAQTERRAAAAGNQFRQAPSQAVGVDAERVAYA